MFYWSNLLNDVIVSDHIELKLWKWFFTESGKDEIFGNPIELKFWIFFIIISESGKDDGRRSDCPDGPVWQGPRAAGQNRSPQSSGTSLEQFRLG